MGPHLTNLNAASFYLTINSLACKEHTLPPLCHLSATSAYSNSLLDLIWCPITTTQCGGFLRPTERGWAHGMGFHNLGGPSRTWAETIKVKNWTQQQKVRHVFIYRPINCRQCVSFVGAKQCLHFYCIFLAWVALAKLQRPVVMDKLSSSGGCLPWMWSLFDCVIELLAWMPCLPIGWKWLWGIKVGRCAQPTRG